MRIGAAQDMLVAGFDTLATMQTARRKSVNVVLRYVENASTRELYERRWAYLQPARYTADPKLYVGGNAAHPGVALLRGLHGGGLRDEQPQILGSQDIDQQGGHIEHRCRAARPTHDREPLRHAIAAGITVDQHTAHAARR